MISEFSLIEKYFRPLTSGFAPALDLRDDAALVSVPHGQELVITKDLLISGVHFIGDEDPALIAQKSLRVNISDLAAKGAAPFAYSLGLALPPNLRCHSRESGNPGAASASVGAMDPRFCGNDTEWWIENFTRGLAADQKTYGIHLLGGDTTRSKNDLMISIAAYGLIPSGGMVKRSGAMPGDLIFVTGTIGDAGLGLRLLQKKFPPQNRDAVLTLPQGEGSEMLINRYLLPQPRVQLMAVLRQKNFVNAAADISDGLLADLSHILHASDVGGRVELAQMPISDAAQRFVKESIVSLSDLAVMGDDYEIVFTGAAKHHQEIMDTASGFNIPVTVCGVITDRKDLEILHNGQKLDLKKLGYEHSIA